jgi:predicted metal-dependent peptidase
LVRTAESLRAYRGTLPGSLAGYFTEFCNAILTPPIVPWTEVLGYLVRTAGEAAQRGAAEYSMRRPAKSSYLRGIPLPGLVEFPPYIGICLDTSGSMSLDDLSLALREVRGILECLQVSHVWLCQADTSVRAPFAQVAAEDLTSVALHGRGGTSFEDVFREVREHHPEMAVLVYFTDGEAFPPSKPDNLHVCWCLTNKSKKAPVPWGDVVYME